MNGCIFDLLPAAVILSVFCQTTSFFCIAHRCDTCGILSRTGKSICNAFCDAIPLSANTVGQSPQRGPGAEPLVGAQGGEAPWNWKVLAKQRQNLYINFPHLLHICELLCRQKNKCDPFVRGSGSAKYYSLGWQFRSFPIVVASPKRHINTRLITLLESCLLQSGNLAFCE